MAQTPPIEWFPVVDESGMMIAEAPRHICHDGKSFLLHPVVHLHLFNTKGEMFLQKRSACKDIQPGKWDTSAGGHLAIGESVGNALERETFEELGITVADPIFIGKYIWKSPAERELVSSFTVVSDQIPVINLSEIDEGRFWTIAEIKRCLGQGIFTPNFEHEFSRFFSDRS